MKYFSMFSGVGGFINPPMLVNCMANKYTAQKINMDKAIKLYESGMTQIEVGKILNTTQKVIYSRFKKINYKCRIAKKRNQERENNASWKGSLAGYAALHYRVIKAKGSPSLCEECGTTESKRFEWANLTKNYSDINDYKRLCKSCHAKFDNVGRNFLKGGDAK